MNIKKLAVGLCLLSSCKPAKSGETSDSSQRTTEAVSYICLNGNNEVKVLMKEEQSSKNISFSKRQSVCDGVEVGKDNCVFNGEPIKLTGNTKGDQVEFGLIYPPAIGTFWTDRKHICQEE